MSEAEFSYKKVNFIQPLISWQEKKTFNQKLSNRTCFHRLIRTMKSLIMSNDEYQVYVRCSKIKVYPMKNNVIFLWIIRKTVSLRRKVSVFGVILVRIFPTLLSMESSVFSPNSGKCGKNAAQNNSEYG